MRELDPATSEAHRTIARLQAAYGDVVTRRDWVAFTDLFVPDAVVHIDVRNPERPPFDVEGAAAMVDFVAASLEGFAFFEFSILNAVAEVEPGASTATGRLYLCELRADHEGAWTQAFGLYRDRYVRLGGPAPGDGDWRIAERRYTSLARLAAAPGTTVASFPIPTEP